MTKKRIMFFVQRRGGGTLFNRLVGQIDDSEIDLGARSDGTANPSSHAYGERSLPTKEDYTCHLLYTQVPELLASNTLLPQDGHAFVLYAEGGGYRDDRPLHRQVLQRWSCLNVEKYYPSDQWEVCYLMRDGRSHVTSLLLGEHVVTKNKEAELEFGKDDTRAILRAEKQAREEFLNDIDGFAYQCRYWKYKASEYIRAARNHPHFTLLKFEDMVKDPHRFIEKVLEHCGLTPHWYNKPDLQKNSTSTWSTGKDAYGRQSPRSQVRRYKNWTDQHFEICYQIMSPELRELGYTGRGVDTI